MESKILKLISLDRIDIPLSSLDNKLRRQKMENAKGIANQIGNQKFVGERTYAFVEKEDQNRARGMKEAIYEFSEQFPKYGKILQGKIAEKRIQREEHLYFGLQSEKRLTQKDYMTVMNNLGISEHRAHLLYPVLTEISRNLNEKKKRETRIIIGKYSLE